MRLRGPVHRARTISVLNATISTLLADISRQRQPAVAALQRRGAPHNDLIRYCFNRLKRPAVVRIYVLKKRYGLVTLRQFDPWLTLLGSCNPNAGGKVYDGSRTLFRRQVIKLQYETLPIDVGSALIGERRCKSMLPTKRTLCASGKRWRRHARYCGLEFFFGDPLPPDRD